MSSPAARGRGGVAVVGEAVVDLVDDQLSLALAHEVGDVGQFGGAEHGAGGIGRRGEEGAGGPFVPVLLQVLAGRLEIAGGADRDADRNAFEGAHEMAVAGDSPGPSAATRCRGRRGRPGPG